MKVLPKPSVIGGVSYISVAIQEPGVIRHFGPIQNLVFGEFDGSRTQRAVNLLSACENAHIGARISNEIEREIWEKFVFLVGLSATTATIRQPIGAIRSNAQKLTTREGVALLHRGQFIEDQLHAGIALAVQLGSTPPGGFGDRPASGAHAPSDLRIGHERGQLGLEVGAERRGKLLPILTVGGQGGK